jgi:NAD(P)-dependent dehydrogenase (short-subunit alcohol dehydrogenase family)
VEVAGSVAVVTGGASGIGRALALALADAGAAGVVVADLDDDGARAVADEIGAGARGIGCDVSDDGQVGALIDSAEEAFGPVALFCANAGVAIGAGLEDDDAVWERALGVNVRGHIAAARHLVPRWLERGGGYFLATASAAGLLTQIGSAPYAVTKHAAVAFAEWLSVTYGDRGIGVSCLCPMGVNTAMLSADDIAVRTVRAAGGVVEPEEVAAAALDAIAAERFLVLPHPEVLTFFQRKAADYDRWLAGMRRLQARLA